jgi:hypothetical protein
MSLADGPRPRGGPLEPVWWAARALLRETLGFRIAYPVETVREAAEPGSLRYHVRSDRLFFDAIHLDAAGIAVQHARLGGTTYNPAYVAWYGLMSLDRAVRGVGAGGRETFDRHATWLARRAVRRDDGAVVWHYTLSAREGRAFLAAPWISAMAQGLAMSALVRARRLGGPASLVVLARAACAVFEQAVDDGGVRTFFRGHTVYEEYPAYPLPRVLDGFLFALLGLRDVALETGDDTVMRLYRDGVEGLKRLLPSWDYRGRWTWYGTHGYLCPPHYHRLNAALLAALAGITGDPALAAWARRWDATRLTPLARLGVFLAFLVTKNRARLVHGLGAR